MTAYLIRRFVLAVTLLVAITYASFWALAGHLNPLYPLLFVQPRPTAQINALTRIAHLNEPIVARYWLWVRSIVTGEGGSRTVLTQTPIWQPVLHAFLHTVELAAGALVVALVLSILLGVTAASRWGRPTDRILRALGYLAWSIPAFVAALVLQAVGGRLWAHTGFHVFFPSGPPTGAGLSYVESWFRHMTLPIVATALGYVGLYIRYVRSAMLDTLGAPYVAVARAKGLRERRVLVHHALRNALVPLLAVLSLDLAAVIGTTLVADIVFGVQGLGGLFLASVRADDPYQMEAILSSGIFAVIVFTFLGDVVHGRLDPRVSME
jgi:peptide/nickel transport system permease protein